MTYRSDDNRDLQLGAVVASAAVGALVMYLLDPERGAHRRATAVDTLRDVGRDTARTVSDAVSGTVRDLSHRAGAADVFHTRDSDESGRVASPGTDTPRVAPSGLATSSQLLPQSLGSIFSTPATGIKALAQGIRERNWDPRVRNAAMWGGGALGLFSLVTRRSPLTMAAGLAGAALLARGASNRPLASSVASAFTSLRTKGRGGAAVEIEKTIRIAASPEQVYELWEHVENFPRFMHNVVEVRELGAKLSHWTVRGPAGTSFEWDSILTEQSRPHRLSWRSVPGGQVDQRGEVQLEAFKGGTRVTVRLSYTPPAGAAGQAIASLIGNNPAAQLEQDLRRMKTLLESGAPPHGATRARTAESRFLH